MDVSVRALAEAPRAPRKVPLKEPPQGAVCTSVVRSICVPNKLTRERDFTWYGLRSRDAA